MGSSGKGKGFTTDHNHGHRQYMVAIGQLNLLIFVKAFFWGGFFFGRNESVDFGFLIGEEVY